MISHDDPSSRRISFAAVIFCVLLLCSVATNYFLWQWGDTQTQHAASVQARLLVTQNELRTQAGEALLMKSMLGLGALTDAEIDALTQAGNNNPDIDVIVKTFVRDMDLFGPENASQNRNYPTLATYLSAAIENCRSVCEAASETGEPTTAESPKRQ